LGTGQIEASSQLVWGQETLHKEQKEKGGRMGRLKGGTSKAGQIAVGSGLVRSRLYRTSGGRGGGLRLAGGKLRNPEGKEDFT